MRPLPLLFAGALAIAIPTMGRVAVASAPLTLNSARVTLNGTSNIHAYTASTTAVTIETADIGPATTDVFALLLQPSGLKAFEVTIPAASLVSEKGDLNKNMHKALKVQQHPTIRFRLAGLERAANVYRATGSLTIAGVERPIAMDLQIDRKGDGLAVTGAIDLLMTDYGIAPPKAMLGMLKTDPKVRIQIELQVGAAVS